MDVNTRRILELKKIADQISVGKRELYLFIVYNQFLLKYGNPNTAQEEVLKCNDTLMNPMDIHEVKQHVFNKNSKAYKFKDKTIREMLDLDETYCDEKHIFKGMSDAEKSKASRDRKSKPRREQKAKQKQMAIELRQIGCPLRQIASVVGVSKSTVERWTRDT